MSKIELSQKIADTLKELGAKETAGVLARSLLSISYAFDANELKFTDSIGTVIVNCTPISEDSKN